VRSSAVAVCAVAIVAAVVPLSVLQIPNAFAWSLPPRVAGAGPEAVASLLRVSGLALPAMAVAALRATRAAGEMAGVAVLLAGAVVGYLAAGAVQLRALATVGAPQASRGALVTVTGRWALLAAAVAAAVALAMAVADIRRLGPRVLSSRAWPDGR